MFAIMMTRQGLEVIFYGPFNDEAQAERYAKFHKIWGTCLVVKLNDSGDALDS